MLVRTLRQLVDAGEYRQCLAEASIMLREEGLDPSERSRIYGAICRCKLGLSDIAGAVNAGRMALAEADLAGEPDLWGTSVVELASALVKAHKHVEAVSLLEGYLAGLDRYVGARVLEGEALIQSGHALYHLGRTDKARRRYEQALAWFERFGDARSAFDCRRALIMLALGRSDLGLAAQLLSAQDCQMDDAMRCGYLLDLAGLYTALGQHQRAIDAAFEVIELAEPERLADMAEAHLVLAHAAKALKAPTDACNFALAARIAAVDGRLYELEFKASLLLIRLLEEYGADALLSLEEMYQQQGVSLYHYVPAAALKHF